MLLLLFLLRSRFKRCQEAAADDGRLVAEVGIDGSRCGCDTPTAVPVIVVAIIVAGVAVAVAVAVAVGTVAETAAVAASAAAAARVANNKALPFLR